MRWSTSIDYDIHELIITTGGGRFARVLRVSHHELIVGDFASWSDLLADLDIGLTIEEDHRRGAVPW